MHDVFDSVLSCRVDQALRRVHVVAEEFHGPDAADLRVSNHKHLITGQALAPRAVDRDVSSNDANLRMMMLQDRAICGMLIERCDRRIAAFARVSHQIVSDQPGASADDDGLVRHCIFLRANDPASA